MSYDVLMPNSIYYPENNINTKFKGLVVGIDATNLRQGGGVTHLIELLRVIDPYEHGIDRIVIWGGENTISNLDDRPWLEKRTPSELNGNFLQRTLWQHFSLSHAARKAGVNVLFVPGGSYSGSYHPVVTMSRNMLPFEVDDLLSYGWTIKALRLKMLRITQLRSFMKADGIIFLSKYGSQKVRNIRGKINKISTIIPHGLHRRFLVKPRSQRPISEYSDREPYRLLYVSTIDQYKNQSQVIEAVAIVRQKTGWPLVLDLVGPAYRPSLEKMNRTIMKFDSDRSWVRYRGLVAYDEMHQIYTGADLGVFASSCENLPIILLETMGAGLPIASSNCGPMPEVLGAAGIYFDPLKPESIAESIVQLVSSVELRTSLAYSAYERAMKYSWHKSGIDTFDFLVEVYRHYHHTLNLINLSLIVYGFESLLEFLP